MLIKEIILPIVYIFFAFIYTRFGLSNSNYTITLMTFGRWFIEGSFTPFLICAAFWEYYIEFIINFFNNYQFYYVFAIMLKIPLFFVMRYAENQSDFFLNVLEAWFFNMLY
jgi:hypothetical protein